MTTREAKATRSHAYSTIGRYRVYSELASGGMATVHLGCMLGPAGFSKVVAIKCLHAEFALESEFVAMFLDEARLTSSIHHPNVVASLDVVAEQGELLVVMEYVHGESLAALLRSSRQTGDAPPLPVVARIMCDALEGLHAAHLPRSRASGLTRRRAQRRPRPRGRVVAWSRGRDSSSIRGATSSRVRPRCCVEVCLRATAT